MAPHPHKRPRRTPLTPEEVSHFIALKKRRELIKLHIFKSTRLYKFQNLFNILCFFIYWELILCFFGPCRYHDHRSVSTLATYGQRTNSLGKPVVDEIEITDAVNNKSYKLEIDDFIPLPPKKIAFRVGSDFLLSKELKASYNGSEQNYRLFAASPVLFLSLFVLLISTMAFSLNLNQNSYSLMALTVLNFLTLLGIICL